MEIPNWNGTSTRSCNTVMPTFAIIKVSQHYLGQILESNPSPSPAFHNVPMIFFFSLADESAGCCRGVAELLPWLLDTQGRTTRFAHSPAAHRLFPDFPTIVFCLPRSGSAFLLCRIAGKHGCLLQLRGSRRTSRRASAHKICRFRRSHLRTTCRVSFAVKACTPSSHRNTQPKSGGFVWSSRLNSHHDAPLHARTGTLTG